METSLKAYNQFDWSPDLLVDKIAVYPPEDFVLLLLQDKDDITRLNPWL